MKIYMYFQKMYDMLACPFLFHLSFPSFSSEFHLLASSVPKRNRFKSFWVSFAKKCNCLCLKSLSLAHKRTPIQIEWLARRLLLVAIHMFREKNAGRYCIYLSHLNKWCEIVSREWKKQLWWNFHLQFWTLTRDVSSILLHQKNFSYWLLSKHFILDSYFMFNA